MKKLLLLCIALMAAWNLQAQDIKKKPLANYQAEIDLGYSFNTETKAMHRINIHTIHGARIGGYLFAGIGTGLDYYHDTTAGGEMALPVFLNMKGYLPVFEDVQPYISMDIGTGIGLTKDVEGLSGGMYGIAVGVQGKRLKAQIGYNMQSITEDNASVHLQAVQIKLGIMF